ncbi:restriction endonuclease subunit S [Flavobacterium lacus]|uniref:Type I restriction modification DNA specificity protein n=1 Tax=Flavobacterium lacus TaxID=1353778 RepID=A0A328X0H0_9FLAO|nr:restriction endonuclease subunit S [Flavobacterium lacus]RAR51075.1 type I restriction modification DNA specificity protein [Flavobacterium lacus]
MLERLENIVQMKSGVFAKSGTNPDLFYIQSTDFDKQLSWNKKLNPILTNSSKFNTHLLKVGDVLFVSKGRNFFAVAYDGAYAPAVASTTFLVLRVKSKIVLPDYLVWFLNHPQTQSVLWSFAKGSSIPSISKTILEQIEIPIPNLSKQNTILELHKLQLQEKKIQKQIGKLRQEYINQLTYKSIE